MTRALPNNWKLYVENVRVSYHASLLHLVFTTFEINRLSQKGGVIVEASGGNHVGFCLRRLARNGSPRITPGAPALAEPISASHFFTSQPNARHVANARCGFSLWMNQEPA